MMKPLSRVYIQGIYLNIIKAIYPNSTANIVPSGEKPKDFPLSLKLEKDTYSHHFYLAHYWKF